MVVAQTVLVLPIIAALTRQAVEDAWREYEEQLRSLGVHGARAALSVLWDIRFSLLTAVLAGLGRASAEVGAVMIVGGNIDGVTRVMTTTIALETSKGDLPLALGLGMVLIGDRAGAQCRGSSDQGSGAAEVRMILPLHVEQVTYAAGGRAIIDGVSLDIEAGPSTIILGANGAGKSVLMRLMHGLLQPTRGRIAWRSAGPRRHQAMVFQRPVMLRRSALANVAYALQASGLPRNESAAMEALNEVGLAHVAHRPARVLSGGEQQRLALARAWALHPEVLFLDEPTANLDPGATREIENIIKAFDAAGTKIVMSTHSLGQARRLGDEVIFLHQGRVAERAPIDRFFAQPASPEAAAFVKGELPWA